MNIADLTTDIRLDAVSQYLDVVFMSCYKRNERRTTLLMSTIVVVLLIETDSGSDLKLKTVEEYLHLFLNLNSLNNSLTAMLENVIPRHRLMMETSL